MKKLHFLLLFILLFFHGNAQQLGEEIFNYQKIDGYFEEDYLNRVFLSSKMKNKNLKDGTFYDSIVFEHFGKLLYVSAKYKVAKYGIVTLAKAGIPKYVENNQPFADAPLNESGYVSGNSTLYHSNGKIWKTTEVIKEDGTRAELFYNFDGTLKRRYSAVYGGVKIGSKREGNMERSNWCFDVNPSPHFHTQPNGDLYLGYPTLGTIITKSGYSLTGFTITLEQRFGNGGVFFLENLATKKTFWATILGGHITALQPATLAEKPDIHQLQKEIEAEEIVWIAIRISKSLKEKLKIPNKVSDESKISIRDERLNLKSKNIENLTGYGISLITTDKNSYDDHVELKVGLFKNGILEGIGQQAKIDYGYTATYVDNQATKSEAKWNIQSGVFKSGVYIEGRTINTTNFLWLEYDIASPIPFPGFQYKALKRDIKLSDYSMKISEVDKNLIAYLPSLERKVTIQSVDKQKVTITVATDVPNVFATIDITKEPFYAWKRTATNYKQACDKYIKKPVYREEDVYLYSLPGETKYSSYTVKGVYYDKFVSTRTTGPAKEVYGKKSVLDHYEDVICYKCKGTGVIDAVNTNQYFAKVVADNNPTLFDRISQSLTETFAKKPTETAKPIEKPVLSKFSVIAQNYISAFDTDKSSNKTQLKKFVLDLDLKLKNEGKTKEQITTEFVKLYNELYKEGKKEYAFEIMMKIPAEYISPILSLLSNEQREYNKLKSREKISSYQN